MADQLLLVLKLSGLVKEVGSGQANGGAMNLTYLEIDHQRLIYNRLISAPDHEFVDALIFSWLYHEHAIEGVVLNPDAINRALSQRPTRNYRDRQIKNSLNRVRTIAMHMIDGTRHGNTIDTAWIKEIHALLSDEEDPKSGHYRVRDTTPGVYNLKCVPGSTVAYHLNKLFNGFDEILKNEHPIYAASKIHWEFMQIFPFDEHSGFVGRLLLNQILIQAKYPPAIFHAMDRQQYFAALDSKPSKLIPVVEEAIKSTLGAAQLFHENTMLAFAS